MKPLATDAKIKKRPLKKIRGSSQSLVRVAASNKSKAIDKRKKLLLEEYANRYKSSTFVDKRFGEHDTKLSIEDKIFERFAKQAQRKLHRSARSTLDSAIHADDDESDREHGGFQLTHGGQALSLHLDKQSSSSSDLSDFDDLSDSEKGHIDRDTVSASHFGGFEEPSSTLQDGKKKSKAEVMKEIIAKSKHYKYERQKAKEENEQMRAELNLEFDGIRSSLLMESSTGQRAPASKLENGKTGLDFDSLVRSLALEGKRAAKAVDRTKTPLELALEEKERLERLELERLARMKDDSHEKMEESDSEKTIHHLPTSTDLNSDSESKEASDLDVDEMGKDVPFENEGQQQHKDTPEDFLFKTSISFELKTETEASSLVAAKELPFAFDCPQTLTEWHTLARHHTPSQISTLLERARKLLPIGLDASHKTKLQHLLISLVEHILYLASTRGARLFADGELKEYVNRLVQFIEMTLHDLPSSETIVKDWFTEKLLAQLSVYQKALQVKMPDPAMLVLYTLIGRIYSTSDFRHAVVTPATLMLAMTLSQAKIESKSDLVKGLYLIALYYDYQRDAKRYLPEAINFLAWTLDLIQQGASKDAAGLSLHFAYPRRASSLSLGFLRGAKAETSPSPRLSGEEKLSLRSIWTGEDQSVEQILYWTLSLIEQGAAQAWDAESPAFIEIYEPFYKTLCTLMHQLDPTPLREHARSLCDKLNGKLKENQSRRQPLRLQEFAPVPLPLLQPRLDRRSADYNGTSRYCRRGATRSLNTDGQEEIKVPEYQRLQKALKRERKGAIRELRKDAHVLNCEKSKAKLQASKTKKTITVLR